MRLVPIGTSPLKAALFPIGPQHIFSASELSEKPSYPIRRNFTCLSLCLLWQLGTFRYATLKLRRLCSATGPHTVVVLGAIRDRYAPAPLHYTP